MDTTHVVNRVEGTVFAPRQTLCGEPTGPNLFLVFADAVRSDAPRFVRNAPPDCVSCAVALATSRSR